VRTECKIFSETFCPQSGEERKKHYALGIGFGPGTGNENVAIGHRALLRNFASGNTAATSGRSTLPTLQCAQPLQQPDHGSYGVGTGAGADSSGAGTDSSSVGTDSSGVGAGEVTAGDSGGVGTGEMAAGGFAGAADGCEGRHA
jgi:hypothetical protein